MKAVSISPAAGAWRWAAWRGVLAGLLLCLVAGPSLAGQDLAGRYTLSLFNGGEDTDGTMTLITGATGIVSGTIVYRDVDRSETEAAIDRCALDKSTLVCRWSDKYGEGRLLMRFDSTFCRFRGHWTSGNDALQAQHFYNGARNCTWSRLDQPLHTGMAAVT